LTWRGMAGLFGLGVFLLPVMPSWGQEEAQPVPPPPKGITFVAGDDAKKAQAELERLVAELRKKQAELAQIQAQIEAAHKKMGQAGAGDKEKGERVIVLELKDGDKREVIRLPAGSIVLGGDAKAKVDAAKGELERARVVLDKKLIEAQAEAGKKAGAALAEV